MSCVWAFVYEGIETSGMGPSSEEQVVRLKESEGRVESIYCTEMVNEQKTEERES